ncbi:MAG: DUF262 domain-containing HNH endonuclease family protein [Chloroflexota bacterium]
MKPYTYTVYDLFQRRRRHVVPLFQRPYVWTRERQWEPLWDDITSQADEILKKEEERSHFMGAAVINKLETFGFEVEAMDIIDGQQRLTTLQILLIALRDFVHTTAYNASLEEELTDLTLNKGRMANEHEGFKVWPTNSDREIFENIVTAKSLEEVEHRYPIPVKAKGSKEKLKPRHALVEGYVFFYNAIQDYVYTHQGGTLVVSNDHMEAIQETITKRLKIVVIELEKGDNPQIIFETLNARGEPLRASDLIRNFVFLEATRQKEDIERLYNTYWREFDEPFDSEGGFWKEEERQGRLTRARLDLLVFYYLTYKTQRELPITSLFQEFSSWWRSRSVKVVETELKDLRYYADLFRQFYTSDTESRLSVFIERLRILDTGTVYPLLLYFAGERKDINPTEFNGIITDLESYLVRRSICGLTSQNYNQFFRSMLQELSRKNDDGSEKPITRADVQRILLSSSVSTNRWPTDEEFRAAWIARPIYSIARKRAEMLLKAIDLQLTTKKQEMLHINGDISIEHIWPQNPEPETWPALNVDSDDIIHTFGNLTLVTTGFNSALSNRPFSEKRSAITHESLLRMNTYFQDLADSDLWTENRIRERSAKLFETARVIWPRA